ncbi:MAG: type II secretion system F family protein [Stellaceae bacterium]
MSTTPMDLPDPISFAIHVGGMHFGLRETCILVLALGAALWSVLSLRRIAQSEERQNRLRDALRGTPKRSGELAPPSRSPWYQRVGTLVVATRMVGKAEQGRLLAALVAAGVKGDGHLAALVAAKLCAAVAFVPLFWLFLEWRQLLVGAPNTRLLLLAGAAILGWRFPETVLSRLAARRRVRLEADMPDALDLLVICAEAGLSLDHAIGQVGHVLRRSSPTVAEEFAATAAEMRVSAVRSQALENLARRAGIPSLRSMVAALNQSINFGTPLAESLRVVAAEMRAERLARFEERAARLPVLLTLPLMAFILPSLIIVIGTPLALRIIDMLGRGP